MSELRPEFRPIDRSQHELLVVDDNPASRYATARLLRSAGFRVSEAASGAEALARLDDSISALVLDVHLPDIDGFEVCAQLRSRGHSSRIPVLHLTAAYVTDEDKVRGLDAGADAYLTRPVEGAVLVATVQALVRTRIAEEAMRRSEAKFRAIYSQSPGGICLLDDGGRVLEANAAMLQLLGRPESDVAGRPLSAFAPAEWASSVDAFARCAGAPLAHQEFPVRRADGELLHLAWSLSPHIEPGVTMAVATDVSQLVKLEEQRRQLLERERVARGEAEQVSRMKDDFIAVLSHELRTPLNAIMGWAHVLQKRGGSEELMRGLAAIERNGQAQARMISDLLDMSRLNLGKLPLVFSMLDPAEAVGSAVNAMRPGAEGGHDIELRLQPSYAPIRADASRLQQVIWNLLSNALKFSPAGGSVIVELAQDDDHLRLRVIDQGQGIAAEFLPLVFDRFAQSDAASNRQRGGLGLGLSIVKQLVEAHGGAVAAYSEGLGRGATFEVRLPIAGTPSANARAVTDSELGRLDALEAAPSDATLEGLDLLVIDDDPDATAMLHIILADRGARVRTARDVESALHLFDQAAPDVLISDIGMAGRDGYDLIRAVRKRDTQAGRYTPAIALTSFARDQDRRQALGAGFDAHCAKPLRPLNLVQQILQAVARTR
jgi:PAS domain S-box-containing protein